MCLTDSMLSKQIWIPPVCLEVGPWCPGLADSLQPWQLQGWGLWGLQTGAGLLALAKCV